MDNNFSYKSIAAALENDTRMPVVMCIGTDRVIGDALGPLVGDELVKADAPFFVYGTLASPVTALSLEAALDFVRARHAGQTLIAVDSSLGKPSDVGRIRLSRGGIRPGLASGKKLPLTGDLSVTATVAPIGERSALSRVRLGFVVELAREIASALHMGIREAARSFPLIPADRGRSPRA